MLGARRTAAKSAQAGASVRAGVERANATMKNWYGMAKVRYRGLARNNCPPSVRRDGDEHEAGASSHGGGLSRRNGKSVSPSRGKARK